VILRRLAVVVRAAAVVGAALVGAGASVALSMPAYAHGGDAPDGTNYRTRVSEVTPALPGVTVRTIEAGARLELANHSGKTVEVLGYDGEPYLEVRPDGVYENVRSPATYLNVTLTGGAGVPADADPAAPPSWRRVSGEPVARWHDHRAHWMTAAKPPQVTADPGREQRIRDWTVPLRVDLSTAEVRGTLDWIPPPLPALWWAGAVLGAAAIGALGLISTRSPSPDRPSTPVSESAPGSSPAASSTPPTAGPMTAAGSSPGVGAVSGLMGLVLGGVALVGGGVAIAYAVAREIDAGKTGLGGILLGLLASQIWPVVAALGAIAAGAYALAGRPAADFALALAGSCLALFAGVANAPVLSSAIAPVPWPAAAARCLVVSVIAIGAGLAAANALRMRAVARLVTAQVPATDADETDPAQRPAAS